MKFFERFGGGEPRKKLPPIELTSDMQEVQQTLARRDEAANRLELSLFQLQNLDAYARPLERLRIEIELAESNGPSAKLESLREEYLELKTEWNAVLSKKRTELGL